MRGFAIRLVTCGLAILVAASYSAVAQDQQPLTESFTWQDGPRQRTVWLHPDYVAEFGDRVGSASMLREVIPSAQVIAEFGVVKIVKTDGGPTSQLIPQARSVMRGIRLSPVFFDHPGGRVGMRALPGGVLLRLDPSWGDAQVQSWLQAKGLTILRQFNMGRNFFLIETQPGLPSLELANALTGQPGVMTASPNWWTPAYPR